MTETEKQKVRALYHKVTKKELFEIAWNWADLMTCDEEDMTWMEKVQEELEIINPKKKRKMEYLTIENLKFHPDVEHEFIIEDDFENNCFPDQRFKSYADTWSFLYEKFPVIYKDDGTQDDRDNDLECFHAINITKYYGLASVRSDQFDPERDKILDNLVFGDEEDAQEYSWDPIIEEYSNHHVVDISRFIQGETMYVDLNLDALYLEEKEVQNA